MEYFQPILDWWNEYYPIVMGMVATVGAMFGAVLLVWSKIKPLLDKITSLKKTVEEKANTLSPLEIIQANTQVTDLKAKLENPTISDSLKLQYQQQLFALENILASTNKIVDKVEKQSNTYL